MVHVLVLIGCRPAFVQIDTVTPKDGEVQYESNSDDVVYVEATIQEDDDLVSAGEVPIEQVYGENQVEHGLIIDHANQNDAEHDDETVQTGEAEVENGEPDPYDDSEHDGLTVIVEVGVGTDPNNLDSDDDEITDGEETLYGTNPINPDIDGNGVNDSDEDSVGTDPLDGLSADSGLLDWGEPTVDANAFAGTYNVTFSLSNALSGFVLCQSNLAVSLEPNGDLYINEPSVTPNGFVLNIEQDFRVNNTVDYSGRYSHGDENTYGYFKADVQVTVPSSTSIYSANSYFSNGYATSSNGHRTLSIYWSVDTQTPNGLRTYLRFRSQQLTTA